MVLVQGFLPERLDRFAEAVLYPSFSPTVGVFLLCSAGYGLWKVRAPRSRGSAALGSTVGDTACAPAPPDEML